MPRRSIHIHKTAEQNYRLEIDETLIGNKVYLESMKESLRKNNSNDTEGFSRLNPKQETGRNFEFLGRIPKKNMQKLSYNYVNIINIVQETVTSNTKTYTYFKICKRRLINVDVTYHYLDKSFKERYIEQKMNL